MHTTRTRGWFTLHRHEEPTAEELAAQEAAEAARLAAEEKKFSQAELDRIIADRLKRQKEQFGDYDDLKAKATKLEEIEAQNQTEVERERTAREAAEQRATEAEQRAAQNEELAAKTLRTSAIVSAAVDGKAVDPQAVVALLAGNADIKIEDGAVVGVTEAVKALLESKPYLLAPGVKVTGDGDGGNRGNGNGNAGDNFKEASKEELGAELSKYGIRTRS